MVDFYLVACFGWFSASRFILLLPLAWSMHECIKSSVPKHNATMSGLAAVLVFYNCLPGR
jgi:hypothetical protein